MSVLICFNLFETACEQRNVELKEVFDKMMQLENVVIALLVDKKVNLDNYSVNEKITVMVDHDQRPTYKFWLDYMRDHAPEQCTVGLICNSDIYVPQETIAQLLNDSVLRINECFALTRWNVKGLTPGHLKKAEFFNRPGIHSQDTWAVRLPISSDRFSKCNTDFNLGVWGCDNRIAYEFQLAGYKVLNPSETVKTYHLHNVTIPRKTFQEEHVPRPYLLPRPTTLQLCRSITPRPPIKPIPRLQQKNASGNAIRQR